MPPYAYAGKASRGLLQHIPSSSSHQIQLPSNQQSPWPLLSTSDSLPAPLTILSLISWGSLKVQRNGWNLRLYCVLTMMQI